MDRDAWVNWEAAGALTMADRIRARLREILDTHEPPPLPEGAAEEIEAILQSAEAREG
jgi:trimethylamine:corrinoid methyltransferase-like protein